MKTNISLAFQFPSAGQEVKGLRLLIGRLEEENKIARDKIEEQQHLMVQLADALALLDRKVNGRLILIYV